ncbi:hypothetical protein SAJA_00905 [Salinisphaera japonica YTM-1]|uniref:Uncharacterized protein n=1 Tax=Salinisphaera japonica YTM-1 TaxID=1209778 RepID=A0A423Q2M4_9GAMM|nr:hypothetical protein SAJA_00905 [Salinisphaera japonica YTM-1]
MKKMIAALKSGWVIVISVLDNSAAPFVFNLR